MNTKKKSVKKKPFKTFYVPVDVFKTGIRVIICADTKRVERLVSKWYGDKYHFADQRPIGKFIWMEDSNLAPTLWLRYPPESATEIASLTHEAFHFTSFLCRQLRIHDDETGAYIIEYVVAEILKNA